MSRQLSSHPGTVAFVAPDGSETVQKADDLPDWVKFAYDSYGRTIPVVLIARSRAERGFTLRSYSEGGRLLAIATSLDGSPIPPAEMATGWF